LKLSQLVVLSGIFAVFSAVNAHEEKQDNSWWWSDGWWNQGQLTPVENFEVDVKWDTFDSNGVDVPFMVARPKKKGNYPAVLFQHGRRGLDELIQKHARRVAARGFVVLAADIYKAHFIGTHPIEHDYELEKDVNNALSVLLKRKDISSKKACLYSHTRGGYYTLKVATAFKRQQKNVSCYVSYYPHWQDPNAPEALQVYAYAAEVDQLEIPTLVFIGDEEQYQRRRAIEAGIESLTAKNRPARLVIYPGVGRGFDFRPENVRTFADDLAAKDALQRAAIFMKQQLK